MSDSWAYLYATDIVVACGRAISDIKFRRDANGRNLLKQKHRRLLIFPPKLSEYDKEIVAAFMSVEEGIIQNLLDLALAARIQGEDFTVMVSTTDFALIKSFYPG